MRKQFCNKFTTVTLSTVIGTTVSLISSPTIVQAGNLLGKPSTDQVTDPKSKTTILACPTVQTTKSASNLSQIRLNRNKEILKSFQLTDNPSYPEEYTTTKRPGNCTEGVTEIIPHTSEQLTQGTKGQTKGGKGVASWYGPGFHGSRTASGEVFNANGLTAAHRTLPFGTKVRVTNLNNGRSVVVRINDRGPHSGGRTIDLSAGAAKTIGVMQSGTAPVLIEVLGR